MIEMSDSTNASKRRMPKRMNQRTSNVSRAGTTPVSKLMPNSSDGRAERGQVHRSNRDFAQHPQRRARRDVDTLAACLREIPPSNNSHPRT